MAILKFCVSLSFSGAVISEGSISSSEGPFYSCLGSLWASCPQAGLAKPLIQHQPAAGIPCSNSLICRVAKYPDFARPGQFSTSLSIAWITAQPGWLGVFVCVGWNSCSLAHVEAKPSTPLSREECCGCSLHLFHLSWQESHEGSVPLLGWARISLSKAGGDRVNAAVVFQIYIYIMSCSCFTCFSKTYATKWAVCVDVNYTHWLLLA